MRRLLFFIMIFTLWLAGISPSIAASEPVVRAILFYSPTCGHCEQVINQVLPPLFEKYGDSLEILGIDVTQPDGQALFIAGLQLFNLESGGVPFLVVGDHYLMGSLDIPEKFPGMIDTYLAQGGVDWPQIPGLAEIIPPAQPTAIPTAVINPALPESGATLVLTATLDGQSANTLDVTAPGSETTGAVFKLGLDPLGNGLAILILAGMLVVGVMALVNFPRLEIGTLPAWQMRLIPILALAGFVVAGYLAYVETARVTAVCGPVGDCNTVQQSEYARLFGVLPIGVLGLLGYVAILLAWLVGRLKRGRLSRYADLALLAMTTGGLLFSIYLTFLEPFVIGAVCAWCLSSALIMTALFWLALKPGKLAYRVLSG